MRLSFHDYQRELDAAAMDSVLNASIETAAQSLDQVGVGVVPLVLDPAECRSIQDALAVSSPEAWTHLPQTYSVRTHPRVVRVFARLYGFGRHLMASTERVAPPATASGPLRLDQPFGKRGRHGVQGFLVLADTDASMEMVPRSHLLHDALYDFMDRPSWSRSSDGGYVFGSRIMRDLDEAEVYFEDGAGAIAHTGIMSRLQSVPAHAGSLVLWDSRTWYRPGPGVQGVPVCMQPALLGELRPVREYLVRQALLMYQLSTQHWPLASNQATLMHALASGFEPASRPTMGLTLEDTAEMPVLRALMGLEPTRSGCPLNALPEDDDRPPLLKFAHESGCSMAEPPSPPRKRRRRPERERVVKRAKRE